MTDLQLSVVIPTLGSHETLARVLDGFGEQDVAPGTFEVVVAVDIAEPDVAAVEDLLRDRSFDTHVVRGEMAGASANRNAGWRAARAPLILFTDNDTIPTRRLVSEHLSWHARDPRPETCVLGLVRWAPEIEVTVFMRWLDTGIQFTYENLVGEEFDWGAFVTSNASVKRALLERVGDFDQERLPYGYEDADWAYRASKHGFRVLYNRAAVVDHLRPMTIDFWLKRVRRVAVAEHTFTQLHPELEPWFHREYSRAARRPPASGRGRYLARFVPRRTPWLGPIVWKSVDVYYKQLLAPHFLEAWEEAVRSDPGAGSVQPDVSEWAAERPGGRSSSGPK